MTRSLLSPANRDALTKLGFSEDWVSDRTVIWTMIWNAASAIVDIEGDRRRGANHLVVFRTLMPCLFENIPEIEQKLSKLKARNANRELLELYLYEAGGGPRFFGAGTGSALFVDPE